MQTKQPDSLKSLFLTELWERYGFYTAQGLLVLFMTKALGFNDNKSYGIIAGFTALAYLMPILGGYVADNMIGYRVAIMLGGVLLTVGYALLSIDHLNMFYLGLATIAVGNGLFKPNVSSLVGCLYKKNDPRREGGFTIFYMGINLGALLATVSQGFIQRAYGWNVSFMVAAVGLVIGLATFIGDRKLVAIQPGWRDIKVSHGIIVVVGSVAMLALSAVLLWHYQWLETALPIAGVIIFAALVGLAWRYPLKERNRLLALILLIIASIFFWGIFFQLFFSSNLFIDRLVNRHIGNFEIPTVVFIGLESVFIVILGAPVARLWKQLELRNNNPSTIAKFGLSFIGIGAGFSILMLSIFFPNSNHLFNPLWVVIAYLLVTLGELLLSPIGLSAVTTLAPPKLVGFMMGVWFFALGLGGELSGILAKFASIPKGVTAASLQSQDYQYAFMIFTLISLGIGMLILLASRSFNRLMK